MADTDQPDSSEVVTTNKRLRNPFKEETRDRREKILELAKKVGFWNLDIKLLATQFRISERSIYNDIDWIKGHYRPEELRNIKIQLDIAAKRAFNKAMLTITEAKGTDEGAKSIDALIKAMKAYREELEEWGVKKKEENVTKFIIERQNERVSPEVK